MDPLSILSTIIKIAQEIDKAARTARRNKTKCRELAERAQVIGDLLEESKAANDTETRRRVQERLRDNLDEALKLVESCRRGGWFSGLREGNRFDEVERKINNCLLELGIANDARLNKQAIQLAAVRDDQPVTNAKAGSANPISMHMSISGPGTISSSTSVSSYNSNKGWNKDKQRIKIKAAAAGATVVMYQPPPPPPMPPRTEPTVMYQPPPPPPPMPPRTEPAVMYQLPPLYGGGDWQQHGGTGVPYYPHCDVQEEEPNSCTVM